jgi:hypothetical protein
MRRMRFLVLLLIALPAAAQQVQLVQRRPPHVLRLEKTEMESNGTSAYAHQTCVIVYGDGSYHLEHSQQDLGSQDTKTSVYESTLSDAEMQQVNTILESPDIKNANLEKPVTRQIVGEGAFLLVEIPRDTGMQRMFITDTSRKTYSKPLKPLLNWVKEMDKRKAGLVKDKAADQCMPDLNR